MPFYGDPPYPQREGVHPGAAKWLEREIKAGRLPAEPPPELLAMAADLIRKAMAHQHWIDRSPPTSYTGMVSYPLNVSVKQAATSLGVSERTVRSLIAKGELRTTRIGRRVLISQAEIARWTADTRGA